MTKADTRHDSYALHTELLNKLFVLVQLLQSLDVHVWQIRSFSLIAVLLVSQNAHGEFWPWESLQPGCWKYTSSIIRIIKYEYLIGGKELFCTYIQ